MKNILFYLALTVWVLSLVVHVSAFLGRDVSMVFPKVWLLHLAVLLLAVFAVLEIRKDGLIIASFQMGNIPPFNPIKLLRLIFRNTPGWWIALTIAGFIYAMLNFVWFAISNHGTPGLRDGEHVLLNHGKVIKTITAAENLQYRALEIRGFSGHWIAFSGAVAAILFPPAKTNANTSRDGSDR